MLPFILVFYSFLGFGSIHLILTMFLFAFLLYFLLIPLATEIPQQLILDPIKRIINIIEKGGSQVIGSNHNSQYDENKNIELQIMNLISLVKNQSNDAAAGILAKKIIHDIKSPLTVLESCKSQLKKFNDLDRNLIQSLTVSIDNIKYILMTLLKTDTTLPQGIIEDHDNPRYFLLKPLLEEIIYHKTLEWHNETDLVYSDLIIDYDVWLFTIPYDLKNKLSNLLNNAMEAIGTDGSRGLIKFNLYDDLDNIIIKIEDNGCGVSEELLTKVYSGFSTKHPGFGFGLSTAIDYFKQLGGDLKVDSEINVGTTITIQIPKIAPPNCFIKDVSIKNKIILLDGDSSIHAYFQSILYDKFKILHFTKVKKFMDYINTNNNLADTTYFIDNYIEENATTGIELVKALEISKDAYLITNSYDDGNLQTLANQIGLKILPKPLLEFSLKNYIRI